MIEPMSSTSGLELNAVQAKKMEQFLKAMWNHDCAWVLTVGEHSYGICKTCKHWFYFWGPFGDEWPQNTDPASEHCPKCETAEHQQHLLCPICKGVEETPGRKLAICTICIFDHREGVDRPGVSKLEDGDHFMCEACKTTVKKKPPPCKNDAHMEWNWECNLSFL